MASDTLTPELEAKLRANASGLPDFDPRAEWRRAQGLGARVVARDDAEYPDLLKLIDDAPPLLYVLGRGSLRTAAGTIAFVGSRRPTPYGLRMARSLSRESARAGNVVVSGLARGIDAACHEGALEARGATWAVLGSGLGRIYPPENAGLARRIVDSGGLLVSEWPVQAAPLREHFPRRNRIISGLCWGTVVVEGGAHSGSVITAYRALDQERELFAVPGPADSALSEIPHQLIRQGATLVRGMADVWGQLPPSCQPGVSLYDDNDLASPSLRPPPSSEHEKILQLLGSDARSLDELSQASGFDVSRLSNIVFEMELRDLIAPVPGQRYAKKGS